VSGGIKNPQGARAMYLGGTIYRIHGTNDDRTVGRANSSGCFRLTNEHVVHLASIAKVGAKVRVLQNYAGGVRDRATVVPVQLFE
jgi:lipoprotein-anchoring transpeptidase ErfK/SrfK